MTTEVFISLDHLAVVVRDTDEALGNWRDRFGFPVLFREVVSDGTLLLTHLDLGNTHLQLVQPLVTDHPLYNWLEVHGPGLHHFCLEVDDIGLALGASSAAGLAPGETQPHQGTLGRRAIFLDPSVAGGVRVDLTGK